MGSNLEVDLFRVPVWKNTSKFVYYEFTDVLECKY